MDFTNAIEQWKELLNVFENAETNNFFSPIYDLNKRIKLAMSLDETNVTTIMILANALEDYTQGLKIPFSTLLEEREKTFEFISRYDKLNKLLHSNIVRDGIESFRNSIKASLIKSSYKINKSFDTFLADDYNLAEVRLSALHSMQTLRIDQFSFGKASTQKPKSTENVFAFSDVNILLRWLKSDSIEDGVFLSLILTEDITFSYFIFSIKNGENIWLLSDKPELPQPNYRQMGRGRAKEKRFSERIASHLFPYELIVHFDEDRNRYVQNRSEYLTSIQNYNGAFYLLGTLNNADPESKLWTAIMMGMIQNKFFSESVPKQELSYTGLLVDTGRDSVKDDPNQNALVLAANSALAKDYGTLNLGEINTKIRDIDIPEGTWKAPSLGINLHLENRYLPQIEKISADRLFSAPHETLEISSNNFSVVPNRTPEPFEWAEGKSYIEPADVTLDDFGTKEEMKTNAIFQARWTQVRLIRELASRDYEDHKKEYQKWYREAIADRLNSLLPIMASGELISLKYVHPYGFSYGEREAVGANIVSVGDRSNMMPWCHNNYYRGNDCNKPKCYFTGMNATVFVRFYPQTAKAVADVLGIEITELPEVFQNFSKVQPYAGNNILSALDPLDHIEDPFNNFEFGFTVCLSKRFYNKLLKEYS